MTMLQNDDAVSKFTFLVLEEPAEAISGFERNTQVRRTGQGIRVVVSMMEPNPGFLLLASDLYVNPEATQILAYPGHAAVDRTPGQFSSSQDPSRVVRQWERWSVCDRIRFRQASLFVPSLSRQPALKPGTRSSCIGRHS